MAAVLLLASLTGNGTGMFGTGMFMGVMWLWLILPLVCFAMIVAYLLGTRRPSP